MHVAIIMDGNGRWAQARGLPRIEGHRQGLKRVEELLRYAPDKGVKYLTLYAFSTENWRRPKAEREFLFSMFERYLKDRWEGLAERGVRLKVIGSRQGLPASLVELIEDTERKLSGGDSLFLQIAFNYGGRDEIVRAIRDLHEKGLCQDVDEKIFAEYLYTAGIPDPDLMIRTSGEKRISNFLLWQLAYTELYFTDVLWPDFDEAEFEKALADYSKRRRRFGGI